MEFTIKLAGIPVGVRSLHESTRDLCRDYLTDEEPYFSVTSGEDEIAAERERSAKADEAEGRSVQPYSDEYLETLAVYRKIAEEMTEWDILLFHGSVIAVDGKAYLFTAPSGTGKSTHTRLWRKVLPPLGHDVYMVNDDKPLLKFTDEAVFACGTPWDGKHHLSRNCMVPLKGVCRIHQAPQNEIRTMKAGDAWPVLFRQSYRPEDPAHAASVLRMLDRILTGVPLFELYCNMDSEAALVSWRAMGEKGA